MIYWWQIYRIFWLFVIALILTQCKNDSPIGKWKDGVIPYYLSGNFSDEDVSTLNQAMQDWESVADVLFIEVTPRAGAYKIIKVSENSWSSSIGENNSNCQMIFGSGGNKYSHITHELGHVLGLLHEHQRPDRDLYVRILWDNIIELFVSNYEKQDNPLITEEQYDYDYNSIMHYPADSFSKDGESNTIESLDDSEVIDRLGIITTLDALKVMEIYGAPQEEE